MDGFILMLATFILVRIYIWGGGEGSTLLKEIKVCFIAERCLDWVWGISEVVTYLVSLSLFLIFLLFNTLKDIIVNIMS